MTQTTLRRPTSQEPPKNRRPDSPDWTVRAAAAVGAGLVAFGLGHLVAARSQGWWALGTGVACLLIALAGLVGRRRQRGR